MSESDKQRAREILDRIEYKIADIEELENTKDDIDDKISRTEDKLSDAIDYVNRLQRKLSYLDSDKRDIKDRLEIEREKVVCLEKSLPGGLFIRY